MLASRSGGWRPSPGLAGACRRAPAAYPVASPPLTGGPCGGLAGARGRGLFHGQRRGDSGAPRGSGSTRASSSLTRVGRHAARLPSTAGLPNARRAGLRQVLPAPGGGVDPRRPMPAPLLPSPAAVRRGVSCAEGTLATHVRATRVAWSLASGCRHRPQAVNGMSSRALSAGST